jgi:hypothetical protein
VGVAEGWSDVVTDPFCVPPLQDEIGITYEVRHGLIDPDREEQEQTVIGRTPDGQTLGYRSMIAAFKTTVWVPKPHPSFAEALLGVKAPLQVWDDERLTEDRRVHLKVAVRAIQASHTKTSP